MKAEQQKQDKEQKEVDKVKQDKAQLAQKEALKLMAAQGMAVEQPKHMSYEEKLA